jgi:molybdopterin/thiamine biosynthesis adenylyltransferase
LPSKSGSIPISAEDIVSAGAISQAALFVLTRFPNVQMFGRIFDDEVTSRTNLNRNMLTLASDVGIPKVLVVERNCNETGLRLEAIPHRFAGKGREDVFPHRVIVGVDDIPSRWDVQRQARGWVGVSGTSHFNVSSSAHHPGTPCSGCLHPVDDAEYLVRLILGGFGDGSPARPRNARRRISARSPTSMAVTA